jgi:hypothetical protein
MQVNIKEINDDSLPAVKKMLEEKLATLEKKLSANLQKKHILDLRINEQYEKIRKMEVSIEKIELFYEEIEIKSASHPRQ